MRFRTVAVVVLAVGLCAPWALGQETFVDFDLDALRAAVVPLTACYAGTMSCGQTATGRVSVDSCESDGLYGVGYSFNGTAGARITISGTSPDFGATIAIADGRSGNSTIHAVNAVSTRGATATISNFTLPYTGPYIILITPGVRFTFGNYSLTLSCTTSNTNCTPSATAVCLLNGRFRVSINYLNQFANPPQPGTFVAARLDSSASNPDTATFGLSDPKAVEVVVRIVDARPFAPRFDIYYGGLTDLEYTVSVTDTVTGRAKTYRNPPGVVGGGVDRVTFPTP